MSNESRFSIEEKKKIALEELTKVTGKDVSTVSLDEKISTYFPESEDDDKDEITGDPQRLEFMINLEMKVCKDVFRLNPEHFFEDDMTLNRFIDLIQEAEDKAEEQEYETVSDVEESEESAEESEDSDDDTDEE